MSILKLGRICNIIQLTNVLGNLHSWTFFKRCKKIQVDSQVFCYRLLHFLPSDCQLKMAVKAVHVLLRPLGKLNLNFLAVVQNDCMQMYTAMHAAGTPCAMWLHKASEQPRGPLCTWHSCHCWQRETKSMGDLLPELHIDSSQHSIVFLLNTPTKETPAISSHSSIANCNASSTHRQDWHAHYQKHIRLLQAQNISETLLINFSSMQDE